MKRTSILFLFLFLANFSYSQTKKKQIIKLKFQIDSLNNAHHDFINEKDSTITRLNSELLQNKREISKLKLENSNFTDEISILRNDSISKEKKIKDLTEFYSNLKNKNINDSIQILLLKEKKGTKKLTVSDLWDLIGIYQSFDSYKLLMPRFTDVIGPKYSINVYAESEYRYDYRNSTDYSFYVDFEYAKDYSGQERINNHQKTSAKIIDFKISNERVILILQSIGCFEYYDMDKDLPIEESTSKTTEFSQKFEIEIQLLENEKIKVFSRNAPKLCNESWNLNGIEYFNLKWSKDSE
jgi:hypothetical protein